MANTLMSADTINDFVISNFIPYAYANMWETTDWERIRVTDDDEMVSNPEEFTRVGNPYSFLDSRTGQYKTIRMSNHPVRRSGSYSFIMTIRPHVQESWMKTNDDRCVVQRYGSTNSHQDLPRDFFSSYCLEIPLICGDYKDPEGRSLNSHTKLKDKYVKHLKNNVWKALEGLHGIAQPITTKEAMFGVHYSRVKKWANGEERSEWAFILS